MAHNGPAMFRIGLLSDTHGLLRPEAKAFLNGSDYIIHGGDIGDPKILEELALLAPVTAVRGNNDKGIWAGLLPVDDFLKVGEVFIYVIHDLAELKIEPAAEGVQIVITGHSHKPLVYERDGVLYVNPGSAGRATPIQIAHHRRRGHSLWQFSVCTNSRVEWLKCDLTTHWLSEWLYSGLCNFLIWLG